MVLFPNLKMELIKKEIKKRNIKEKLSDFKNGSFETVVSFLIFISENKFEMKVYQTDLIQSKMKKISFDILKRLKISKKNENNILLYLEGIRNLIYFDQMDLSRKKNSIVKK